MPTPPLHVQAAVLHAIAYGSRNSAWAVGGYGNRQGGSFPLRALVEHWDGHKWSVMPSPDPGVTQNGLIDAIAESPDAFWTLAALDSSDVVVEHWDGTAWHTYRLKGFTSYTATMTLTGSDDVWVVGEGRHGDQYDLGSERVRYMHWDGHTWSVIPAPKVNGRAQIHAIVPSSPLDVWAVGDIESTDTTKGIQPLVEHWDGTKWSVAPSPTFTIPPAEGEMDPISASASLFGVAIQSGGRPWAVGQKPAGHGADQQPLIEAAATRPSYAAILRGQPRPEAHQAHQGRAGQRNGPRHDRYRRQRRQQGHAVQRQLATTEHEVDEPGRYPPNRPG